MGQWLIDSGCSNHYTATKHILSDYADIKPVQILTGKGHVLAQGCGSITLHTSLGTPRLNDVMWVPHLAGNNNLLSIPQLVRRGCDIAISDRTCLITDRHSKQQFLTGTFDGKGFNVDMATCPTSLQVAKLTTVPIQDSTNDPGNVTLLLMPVAVDTEPTAMLGGTEDTQLLEIWYMRLGHLAERAIRDLVTQSTGMTIGAPMAQTLHMCCELCLRGSKHCEISYQRGNPTQKLLEHVWADVKGPLLEKDLNGAKYFVIFVDEKSRFTTVYPLLEKTDVFSAYKLFEACMERVASSQILNLHVD